MAAIDPGGDEKYWVDGTSAMTMRKSATINTGEEKYWVDGYTARALFPDSSVNGFLMMFDW